MNEIKSGFRFQRAPWWWYPEVDALENGFAPRLFSSVGPGQHWVRAIDVNVETEALFPWVTQLRRAPYSYDWIDNFGRRSPPAIDWDLVDVCVGDSVMTIFTVIGVVPGKSMTICMNPGVPTLLFGRLTVHYEVESKGSGSRIIVEMVVPRAPGPLSKIRRYALAWGDLLMMRKQLRKLKRLAEKSADFT